MIKIKDIIAIEIARFDEQGKKVGLGAVLDAHGICRFISERENVMQLITVQQINIPGWEETLHLSHNWFVRCASHLELPGINIRQHFIAGNSQLLPKRVGIYLRPNEVEGVYKCIEKIILFDPEVRNLTPHCHDGQAEELACICCSWRTIETDKRAAQPFIDLTK